MVGNIYVRGAGGHDDNVGVTTFSGFTHIKTAVTNTAYQTIESTATNSYPYLRLKNDAREYQLTCHGGLSDAFTIYDGTSAAHRFLIDSNGKVLVGGQTSQRSAWFNQSGTFKPSIQVEGSGEPGGQYLSLTANNNASGYGARFFIGKTRGTTAGATTVVSNGDEIGGVSWFGSDGSEMVEAANILSYVDGATGSNDMPGSLRFSTTADTQSSPTEALRIDSSGRLQLGSTTLAARNTFNGIGRLNIQNNSADGTVDFTQGIVFTDNASNEGAWTHAGIVCTGSTGYDGNLVFGTDGSDARDMSASSITEKMRLTADGNLLLNQPAEAAGKIGMKGTNSNGSTCYAVTSSGKAGQGIDITCTTVGDGNYGGAVSFGCGGNGRSAIAGVQIGSDDDRNGLSFFVHPSTNGSDNTVEKLRLEPDGHLALGGAIGNSNIKGSSGTGNEGVYLVSGNPSQFAASNTSVMALNRKSTEGRVFEVRYNGTVRGYFDTNGSSLPSDKNYKTNISDLTLGLSFVNKLKPSQFRFKDSESTSPILYGLIAQDVEESLTSEGVSQNSTQMLQYKVIADDDNESDYYLDYGKLTPVLINAVKELSTEIDKLKAEIAALKSS